MTLKLIQQGAEAKIILDDSQNLIIKDRISKSYRHPELDKKIIKSRTKSETKLLQKAGKIINCPLPFESKEFNKIFLPYISGKKLSEHLDNFTLKEQKEICREIGESVAKLHKEDIIHGDLTTSNMILMEDDFHFDTKIGLSSKDFSSTNSKKSERGTSEHFSVGRVGGKDLSNQKIFFIDFGLGFISRKIEDKAVDLHLLKHAIEAKHFKHADELIKKVFESYKKNYSEAEKIFERINAIEKRGRYRH